MPTLDFRTTMPVSAEDLFAWHARRGAFERLVPPWAPVRLEHFEGIRDGDTAVLRLGAPPLALRWVARHEGYEAGHQFRDVQVRGPFARWRHTHRTEPRGPGESTLHDHLRYRLPAHVLAQPLVGAHVRRQIERQFAYRHRLTRADLAAHRQYGAERLTVAVSGASGLIGSALVPLLRTGGHRVLRLVRRPSEAADAVYWNPRTGAIDVQKLRGVDAVVHLAGEHVLAPRWSAAKKARIYRSRVAGTRLLSEALAAMEAPPHVLVGASGIGYYGDRGAAVCTEEEAPGRGFLAAVCRDWEAAARPAAEAGIRTVQARLGVVLSPAGGALRLLLPAFRLGLGGTAAPDQWLSWIALDDALYGLYHALATPAVHGPVNLVAPNPAPMRAFAQTLGHVLHRPAPLHVPPTVVRRVMGEAAGAMALTSLRAAPEALAASGYAFRYPDLEAALHHQLGRTMEPLR